MNEAFHILGDAFSLKIFSIAFFHDVSASARVTGAVTTQDQRTGETAKTEIYSSASHTIVVDISNMQLPCRRFWLPNNNGCVLI
jgi:hypothetical protein